MSLILLLWILFPGLTADPVVADEPTSPVAAGDVRLMGDDGIPPPPKP